MNAYSIIHNYGEPTYSPDFNFINAALSSKQTALNNNRQKLNNAYDQFAALQVRKDIDQEYIEERLQKIIGLNSQYHSMDLSDDNFASQVLGNVTQLLDDKVKNAITATKRMQAEDQEWEEARKNPKANYAEINERYAKAMSDRSRYLNSEVTGDQYLGGANFIEYTDYRKMLADKMPQLAEKLKAKWIETGPGEGYFKSLDTYEGVTPDKIRSALSTILGEKELKQMEIDAWGRFGDLDNSQIEELNKSYYQPTIEKYSEKLAKTRNALKTTTNEEEKKVLQEQIQYLENSVSTLNSKSDTKVTDANKKSVYTEIFKQNFADNIVETYSGVNWVDRKIDETHARSVEFGQKLKMDAHRVKMDKADLELKVRKQEFEEKKKPDEGDELYLTKTPLRYSDVDGVLSQKFQTEDKARKDFSSLFGALPAMSDYADLKQKFNQLPELVKKAQQTGKPAYFSFNGKQVELTDENIKKLNNFRDEVLDESVSDKMLNTWANTTLRASTYKLAKLVANSKEFGGKGSDINPYGLPNYAWKVVGGKVVPTKEGTHYHTHLLNKVGKEGFESLTKDEEATLGLYHMTSVLASQRLGLTESQKRVFFEAQRKKAIFDYGMTSQEFKKIGTGVEDVEKRAGFAAPKNYLRTEGNIFGPEFDLSNIKGVDAEYYDKNGKEVSMKGFKTSFKEAVTFADNTVLKELEKEGALPNLYNTTIPPAHPKFKTMTTLLQQNGASVLYNNKEPYEIELQVNEDGTYGDKVKVMFTAKQPQNKIDRPSVYVDRESIEKVLGKEFETLNKTPYNAKLGAAAKKIDFGRITIPKGQDPVLVKMSGLNKESVPKEVYKLLDLYQKRELTFSFEPDPSTLTYFGVVRDLKGNLISSTELGDVRYSVDDVVTLQKNGDQESLGIMSVILDEMIGDSKASSFIQEGLNYYGNE